MKALASALIRDAQSEKQFMDAVLEYADLKGYRCYHTFDSRHSVAGFPDIIAVKDRVVAIELKVKSGRLSSAQHEWIQAFEQAGTETHVFYPSDWEVIKKVLK